MACAALVPPATQPVLTELDEDMIDLGHKAKAQKKKG